MKHHSINQALDEATREGLLQQINSLATQWPHTVLIPEGQKRRLAKMGSRTRPFVEDAIKLAAENPDILPRSHDPATLRAKLGTVENLRAVHMALQQVTEKFRDTLTVAGAELYEDARLVYTIAKTGARPSGLVAARQQLAQRFKGNRAAPATDPQPES